jgi:hypothetical protein
MLYLLEHSYFEAYRREKINVRPFFKDYSAFMDAPIATILTVWEANPPP